MLKYYIPSRFMTVIVSSTRPTFKTSSYFVFALILGPPLTSKSHDFPFVSKMKSKPQSSNDCGQFVTSFCTASIDFMIHLWISQKALFVSSMPNLKIYFTQKLLRKHEFLKLFQKPLPTNPFDIRRCVYIDGNICQMLVYTCHQICYINCLCLYCRIDRVRIQQTHLGTDKWSRGCKMYTTRRFSCRTFYPQIARDSSDTFGTHIARWGCLSWPFSIQRFSLSY